MRAVLTADDVRRALTRIAHEIVERNQGVESLAVVGLQRGGVWMAPIFLVRAFVSWERSFAGLPGAFRAQ